MSDTSRLVYLLKESEKIIRERVETVKGIGMESEIGLLDQISEATDYVCGYCGKEHWPPCDW